MIKKLESSIGIVSRKNWSISSDATKVCLKLLGPKWESVAFQDEGKVLQLLGSYGKSVQIEIEKERVLSPYLLQGILKLHLQLKNSNLKLELLGVGQKLKTYLKFLGIEKKDLNIK